MSLDIVQWILSIAVFALIAWLFLMMKSLTEKVDKNHNFITKECNDYKLHVAENYPTTKTLKEMEGRIINQLNRIEDRLHTKAKKRS